MTFEEMNILPEIKRAIAEMGFTEATEIQSKAIPEFIEGGDIIGRSSTGTGKTAAFGIPLLSLAAEKELPKSSLLVLSPTRELAMQISDEMRRFAKYMHGVSIATVYGGAPMEGQIRQLRTANIVIGTPGRIMDHMRRKTLKLDNLHTIVLDEADEMLNMGFYEDIQTILESAPANRQTVLFSATMPRQIMKITEEFQNEPKMIAVDGGKRTVDGIEQSWYAIPQSSKNDTVKLLLEFHRPKRALVFCNTKKMVDELTEMLSESGFKAVGLHGDLRQNQRTSVMNEFKSGRANILIATDVAARGIDVSDVEAVINYDIPQEYEYYIHRIGRTGRAGKTGRSFTLAANRTQQNRVREIERYVGAPITHQPVPTLESITAVHSENMADEIRKKVDEGEGYEYKSYIEALVKEGYNAIDIAAALYAKTASKSKRLAKVKNISSMDTPRKDRGEKKDRPAKLRDGKTWLYVTIGSDDKIGPNFIVGAIVEATELSARDVGKIDIFNDYTAVELTKENAKSVMTQMENTKIKGKRVEFSLIVPAGSENSIPTSLSSKRGNNGGRGTGRGGRDYQSSRNKRRDGGYGNKKPRMSHSFDKVKKRDQ